MCCRVCAFLLSPTVFSAECIGLELIRFHIVISTRSVAAVSATTQPRDYHLPQHGCRRRRPPGVLTP
jgi:hypothetical protein